MRSVGGGIDWRRARTRMRERRIQLLVARETAHWNALRATELMSRIKVRPTKRDGAGERDPGARTALYDVAMALHANVADREAGKRARVLDGGVARPRHVELRGGAAAAARVRSAGDGAGFLRREDARQPGGFSVSAHEAFSGGCRFPSTPISTRSIFASTSGGARSTATGAAWFSFGKSCRSVPWRCLRASPTAKTTAAFRCGIA